MDTICPVINLTAHPIRIQLSPTETVEVPRGTPAGVVTDTTPEAPAFVDDVMVPTCAIRERVVDLPDYRADSLYVVSREVVAAAARSGRRVDDLLVVGPSVAPFTFASLVRQ